MYRLYGMVAAFVFIIGMAGYHAIDRSANYKAAKATVYEVDRKCDMVPYQRQPMAGFQPHVTQMQPPAKGAPAQQEKRQEYRYDPPHR